MSAAEAPDGSGVAGPGPLADVGRVAAIDPVALHHDAIVVDGHNDLAWRIRERSGLDLGPVRLDERSAAGHTDIPRLREGGVDVQFWAAYVPTRFTGPEGPRVAREQIDLITRLVARYPADLELARTLDDVYRITSRGAIASLIGVEGGHAIDGSLDILAELYALGVRYLTLTHTATLDWVDAAGDTPRNGGLSAFGREVVRELNRLGMMVDLSHVSADAMRAALETSAAPVIFSHSSARALIDHPRNVPDDVLVGVRENGGVVMVNFYPGFLVPGGVGGIEVLFEERDRIEAENSEPAGLAAALDAWRDARFEHRGSVATIADHIEHIASVAGLDHVGLGSDFDGVPVLPEGMEDVSRLPALTAELVRRGMATGDVRKVLGGNILRVLGEVEAVAVSS